MNRDDEEPIAPLPGFDPDFEESDCDEPGNGNVSAVAIFAAAMAVVGFLGAFAAGVWWSS